MRKGLKYGLWGFAFGTVGVYIVAMLSLMSPIFEFLFMPVLLPGKFVASMYAGPDGSTAEVVMLTLFNGVMYGVLFWLLSVLVRTIRNARAN